MLLAAPARTRSRVAVRPAGTKPIVLLYGEESPARIITACVRAMFRTRVPVDTISQFMEETDRTETVAELAQVCSNHVVLRDC